MEAWVVVLAALAPWALLGLSLRPHRHLVRLEEHQSVVVEQEALAAEALEVLWLSASQCLVAVLVALTQAENPSRV